MSNEIQIITSLLESIASSRVTERILNVVREHLQKEGNEFISS